MEYAEIKQKLLDYEAQLGDEQNLFKGGLLEPEACAFVMGNANAFLFGLLADASVKAETAWSLPYRLQERLRHFDLRRIAEMDMDELTRAIKAKPALHRFPANMARYIHAAAQLLLAEYDGDAANIWANGATAACIVSRLEGFKGISRKKAALGALLLARDLDVEIADKENIDIVYDVHIRRVFLRAGLCHTDTYEAVTAAAKRILPQFPARLTTSVWAIGRDFCRPTQPLCNACPLSQACASKENRAAALRAP